MSAIQRTTFTVSDLPAIREVCRVFLMKPEIKGKTIVCQGCLNEDSIPHPKSDPGKRTFPLKLSLVDGCIHAVCKTCGVIPDFAARMGLTKEQAEPDPIVEASPECPTDRHTDDSGDSIPKTSPSVESEPVTPSVSPTASPASPAKTDDSEFMWIDDFCKQPQETSWLIRNYLELDCLSVLFGDSQTGKSFVAIDFSCHIAHGLKWCGKRTKKGLVLYIAAEGKNGLKRRLKAWHEYHRMPMQRNMVIRTVPAKLCDSNHTAELIEKIKSFVGEFNPVLIVIDTLNRNFGCGDENNTEDMTLFVDGMNQLKLATGACVLAVHHVGHGNKDRIRGAIALTQAVDFEYRVERTGEPEKLDTLVTTMVATKWKDSAKPKDLAWNWNLQSLPWMELDDDDHLIPVNSIVLTPTDYEEKPKVSPLGKAQQKALDCLQTLFDTFRANLVSGGHSPEGARVSVKDWDESMKTFEGDPSNRSRARGGLEKRNLVVISDGYVEIA